MRTMIRRDAEFGDTEVEVYEHAILKNLTWEYYFIVDEGEKFLDVMEDYRFAFVQGDFPEFGTVYMPEVKPHILSRTTDLDELMPAIGWEWKDA